MFVEILIQYSYVGCVRLLLVLSTQLTKTSCIPTQFSQEYCSPVRYYMCQIRYFFLQKIAHSHVVSLLLFLAGKSKRKAFTAYTT